MKLKKVLDDIKEKFAGSVYNSWKDEHVEFFMNPSRKEILDVLDSNNCVRYFTNNDDKEVYVWNASRAMHSEVAEQIYFDNKYRILDNNLYGQAKYIDGKLKIGQEMTGESGSEFKIKTIDAYQIRQGEYDWLEKNYFDIEGFKRLEEEFYKGAESRYGKYVEIFKNPTVQEIKSIEEETQVGIVRFIADKESRDVYVNASEILHSHMVKEIDELQKEDILEKFSGIGYVDGNKIIASELAGTYREAGTDEYSEKISSDILEGEYDWLENKNFDLSEVKFELE